MPHRLERLLPPGPAVDARAFVEELSAQWPSAQAQAQHAQTRERNMQAQTQSSERPHVLLNMVSTLDGHATLGGRSGAIGNRADRELFHALRTVVDAVLVGAGTARAEHYRELVRDEQARALRCARGLAVQPLACVVSERLVLGDDIPLLDTPGARVAIITPSQASLPGAHKAQIEYVRTRTVGEGQAGEEQSGEGHAGEGQAGEKQAGEEQTSEGQAATEQAGDGRLDLPAALMQLRERFAVRSVLCEGGPHLNGQLLAAGVVDELFLSLAPKLAGGTAASEALRIVAGIDLDPPLELELLSALESESHLFLRYGVAGRSDTHGQ